MTKADATGAEVYDHTVVDDEPTDAYARFEKRNAYMQIAYPTYLDGRKVGQGRDVDRRAELAKFLTEPSNDQLARAFVNRPLILLADEPTGNLDPQTSEGIMRLLDRINKTGTTVVMATHDQRIVNMMRRRVIQLDRGTIVRDQARGVYE